MRDARSAARPTGLLFFEQSAAALRAAVEDFDRMSIDPHACRQWAERFSAQRFRDGYADILDRSWQAWQRGMQVEDHLLGEPR